jgi:glycosyltransferase involved in cell wall biosynthesis
MNGKNKLICIDAVGIRGHGGAAVLMELIHWLPQVRPDWRWHVFLFDRDLREFDDPSIAESVILVHIRKGDSGLARLHWVKCGLKKKITATKADVCFSLANIGAHKPSVPQVVFVHQSNAFFTEGLPKGAFLKRWRMRFMRRQILMGAIASQAVIVQTDAMREQMIRYAPSLNGCIHVIPSGYRTKKANQDIRNKKKALIDRAGKPRLIYVTHPSEHKNHDALISALPHILEKFPTAQLLLTLERDHPPNSRYEMFVQQICKSAHELKVSSSLVCLGILKHDEVTYALENSDLMVFPSLSESFGLGLVEAMAAGCPVVASDLPYAHDVAGNAAVYFDPHNPESIALAVTNVLKDENLRRKMQKSGYDRKHLYSYRIIADKIADVLDSAARSKRAITNYK